MDEVIDWDGALARVKAGELFTAFAGEPAMPSRELWARRLRGDAAFMAAVLAAVVDQDADAVAAEIERRRLTALASKVPDAVYEQVLSRVAAGESLFHFRDEVALHESQWWARRAIDPAFDLRVREAMGSRHGVRHTAEEFDAALKAIAAGSLTSDLTAQGLPSEGAIRSRASRNPAFGRRYAAALASRPRNSPAFDVSQHLVALSQNEIYATVSKAVPRWADPNFRDDLISEIVMAVLAEEIELDEAPKHWRDYQKSMNPSARRNDRSLDQELYADSSMTLRDRISSEADHF